VEFTLKTYQELPTGWLALKKRKEKDGFVGAALVVIG
jgi:hypothetical protein